MTFAQNRNIFTLCKKSSFCYYFVKRYIFLSLILSKDIFSKQTSKKNCWHTFMLTASPHHSKHHSDHINPSPSFWSASATHNSCFSFKSHIHIIVAKNWDYCSILMKYLNWGKKHCGGGVKILVDSSPQAEHPDFCGQFTIVPQVCNIFKHLFPNCSLRCKQRAVIRISLTQICLAWSLCFI